MRMGQVEGHHLAQARRQPSFADRSDPDRQQSVRPLLDPHRLPQHILEVGHVVGQVGVRRRDDRPLGIPDRARPPRAGRRPVPPSSSRRRPSGRPTPARVPTSSRRKQMKGAVARSHGKRSIPGEGERQIGPFFPSRPASSGIPSESTPSDPYFRNLMPSVPPVASHSPPGAKAMARTPLPSLTVRTRQPVRTSQSMIVLSMLAVARRQPSADKASDVTQPLCVPHGRLQFARLRNSPQFEPSCLYRPKPALPRWG